MDRIGFDGHELAYVATALEKATAVAAAETSKVVSRGALNIKTGARRRITGLAHARRYPYAIDYDLHVTGRGAVADVGANKDKPQGALGNLLEYGSIKNPPHPHIRPAADDEMPKFEKAMDDLAVKALEL
ncbi:MAG TPA: hypothetical protein VHK64_08580 [Nocardioidaceae bacterium]|jgi:hypothetical protein|nr:hypothetical protein [Nocardioidaceae bacterium]